MTYGANGLWQRSRRQADALTLRRTTCTRCRQVYPIDTKYNDYEFGAYGMVASLGMDRSHPDYNGGVPRPTTPEVMSALQTLATKNA